MADWQQAERAAQRRALIAAREDVVALRDKARGYEDDRVMRRAYARVIKRLDQKIGALA